VAPPQLDLRYPSHAQAQQALPALLPLQVPLLLLLLLLLLPGAPPLKAQAQ
jgi:hypothetical protein